MDSHSGLLASHDHSGEFGHWRESWEGESDVAGEGGEVGDVDGGRWEVDVRGG